MITRITKAEQRRKLEKLAEKFKIGQTVKCRLTNMIGKVKEIEWFGMLVAFTNCAGFTMDMEIWVDYEETDVYVK